MAAPDGHEQLPVALSSLKRDGVDVVVSMLTGREESRLGLVREQHQAMLAGLVFLRLPTGDFHTPTVNAIRSVADDLVSRLAGGQHVVIHCRAGIGRSSTLAAAVLIREGVSPDQAWEVIGNARRSTVPETPGQRDLIGQLHGFAEESPH